MAYKDEEEGHGFLSTPQVDVAKEPKQSLASNLIENVRSSKRAWAVVACFITVSLCVVAIFSSSSETADDSQVIAETGSLSHASLKKFPTNDDNLHILLPASDPNVNLCKTMLSASVLGYSTPTVVAWDEHPNADGLLGGGSHLLKISRVLEYLESLPTQNDKDLVLMLDAYDIWFQLPSSVLVDRYHAVINDAQVRLIEAVGDRTVDAESISQSIVFAAGKRCAPNQPHTIACYPLPESPLPKDLYNNNTDTIIGRNKYYSYRQRFLNSGYIMGPVAQMRALFLEAQRRVEQSVDQDPHDNGSHGSDSMYHGSDQSIFNDIFGRQEWAREVLRLRHLSTVDKIWSPATRKPRSSSIEGTRVDNIIDPSFSHEYMDRDFTGSPYEFGITLDYWSDLGHQTVNSELDARWLQYGANETLRSQIQDTNDFDCKLRLPALIPNDLKLATPANGVEVDWAHQRLYTHICLARIPVMIHHNGHKEAREEVWDQLWLQPDARHLFAAARPSMARVAHKNNFDAHKQEPGIDEVGGVWTDKGNFMPWEDLCPNEWDDQIFK